MKYYKKITNGGHGFGFFIASLFIIWSIFAFFDLFWNFGTTWVGYIWLGLGLVIMFGLIGDILKKKNSNNRLSMLVLQEIQHNPGASYEDISKHTGIPWKYIGYIVLNLRLKGFLTRSSGSDHSYINTEQIMPVMSVPLTTSSTTTYPAKPVAPRHRNLPKFCPSCGAKVERNATQFCAYCGYKF